MLPISRLSLQILDVSHCELGSFTNISGAVPREVTLSSGNSITKDGREDEGRDVAGPQCALIRTFLRLLWQLLLVPLGFALGMFVNVFFFIREGFDYHLSQTGPF